VAATKKTTGPVKGASGTEFAKNDKVTVGERAGTITGFTRDGSGVYVRFDAKSEGKPIAGKFSRLDVTLSA
jgi:hypothetical protein